MTNEIKNRYIAYSIGILSICCYIFAILFHDIPSYEQDYLKGIDWILHWCLIMYLPLFPLFAGIFAIITSSSDLTTTVTTANFLLTLLFTIFACGSHVLSTSWIFLSVASFLPMLVVQYDKYLKSINQKDQNQ